MLSFPFDTTLSAHKLVHGGLFDRFPELVLVLAHLGGTLPYLARRIDIAHDSPGFFANYRQPQRRPSEDMRKLYVDTALGWNRGAFECARELVGIDHIVFGTDYFIRGTPFMEWTSEFINGLGLKPSEREMIYEKTAARILKLNG
jgi:predicted TIM-barrel fold metal-dependent hydrolase